MIIQRTETFEIDIQSERKRISKAFNRKSDKTIKDHLNKLMDFIEQEKWEDAHKELESRWWNNRDEKRECPRLEFVGIVLNKNGFPVRNFFAYNQLVYNMIAKDDNIKWSVLKGDK